MYDCTEPFQLAYLPVLPCADGVAEEPDVAVGTVAVVDVDAASATFVATRRSIHACCSSVKDGDSVPAGSDMSTRWLRLAKTGKDWQRLRAL